MPGETLGESRNVYDTYSISNLGTWLQLLFKQNWEKGNARNEI